MTTKPKDLLELSDYSNYRNIRAVSRLFVFLGSILVMGGVLAPLLENENSQEKIHPAFAVGIVLVGLAGAIGGMAALRGNRRWASLVKVMATLYFFVFPLGTILSYVLLTGLPRYLDNFQQLRAE